MPEQILTWRGVLYESKHKSVDWFWLLGLIVVISVGTAIYFRNYPFAAVLFISGMVVAMYANDHIQEEEYGISTAGIGFGEEIHKYADIKSFWVYTDNVNGEKQLLLNLKRTFFNHVSIPLGDTDPEKVRLLLRKYILERKQMPLLSDAIMGWMRF